MFKVKYKSPYSSSNKVFSVYNTKEAMSEGGIILLFLIYDNVWCWVDARDYEPLTEGITIK